MERSPACLPSRCFHTETCFHTDTGAPDTSPSLAAAVAVNPLVERAVTGLLRICHRLLPYKEDTAETLLRRCASRAALCGCRLRVLSPLACSSLVVAACCPAGQTPCTARQLPHWPPAPSLLQPEADHRAEPRRGVGDG